MAEPLTKLSGQVLGGRYVDVLTSKPAEELVKGFVSGLLTPDENAAAGSGPRNLSTKVDEQHQLGIALAAFNAFLQTNVTGPVLEGVQRIEAIFSDAAKSLGSQSLATLRKACFRVLEIDGIAPYSYIPNIELFALARAIITSLPPTARALRLVAADGQATDETASPSVQWLILRIHVWHYKLLTQPSLGPGSAFVKSSHWTDLPSLQDLIEKEVAAAEKHIFEENPETWTVKDGVLFLVEKANIMIMLGQDAVAAEVLKQAAERNGFAYALSGALGKRTKFQEKSISQLVVLAKSGAAAGSGDTATTAQARPQALPLNNDTLLENLEFTKGAVKEESRTEDLPSALAGLSPDDQPQLLPLDQIILLTEATMKDAFSPADSLASEEVLPFAVRVISDKSTNWQIYTQALLVRSRIEVHRSRTLERGVLQMQAVVDQVIADTTTAATTDAATKAVESTAPSSASLPEIKLTTPGESMEQVLASKPSPFFPAAQTGETAPAHIRLQYLHALHSPPRWHLESELAYAWVGVGSLASALEIFQRLRLWAEVALCHASRAVTGDEDGRGSSGEDKAKTILRWCLFHRSPDADGPNAPDPEDGIELDISRFTPADFQGPPRDPAPPNAPRLFCILGDIENDPAHYQRAWDISNHRFSRAQKSLGEYYLRQKNWDQARASYNTAVAVNRHSPDMWNRLGDINLSLGKFADAAEAFRRSITLVGDAVGAEDARTWSNLGSALYSLYAEKAKELKEKNEKGGNLERSDSKPAVTQDDEEPGESALETTASQNPTQLLSQSLAAYKRGATISQENWQIWDNVITLGARLRPPATSDVLLAMQNVIRIRNTEDALDVEVLRLLLNDALLTKEKPEKDSTGGIYQAPRGTPERALCNLLEDLVVPLITTRSELWELIARERVWRRDYSGAVDASERAWRAAIGGAAGGLLPSSGTGSDNRGNWLENKEAWQTVVERTDDLVSILENYGEEVPEIGAKWKAKARSAIRSVLGKAKDIWDGSEEWDRLTQLLEGLR